LHAVFDIKTKGIALFKNGEVVKLKARNGCDSRLMAPAPSSPELSLLNFSH